MKNTGGSNVNLTGGEMNGFVTVVWTGTVYLLQAGLLGQLATLNIGAWLKNDGSGNLTIKNGANVGDDGSGNFEVLPQYLPPPGFIGSYGGASAPAGWLLCNGQAVSRTTYAALFVAAGITFGAGDGVTTFNIPDMRGRVAAGVDGGANRLTTATMSSQALGGIGGGETETLTATQVPTINVTVAGISPTAINPTIATAFAVGGGNSYIPGTVNTLLSTGSSTNTGGAAHPNVQPTIELNYLIKT